MRPRFDALKFNESGIDLLTAGEKPALHSLVDRDFFKVNDSGVDLSAIRIAAVGSGGYRAPEGSYEIAFGNVHAGLAEFAERIGAKYYKTWRGPKRFNNVEALLQMQEASKIHFSTKGLSRTGGGILDHAYMAKPMGTLPAVAGTDVEIGMAFEYLDDHGVPLIKKTMFHDGSGNYMSADDFIRKELAAGNVKTKGAREWLAKLLSGEK